MKLTKVQKEAILPLLRVAVQAQIDQWDAERQIEGVVDAELDCMSEGLEALAVSYDQGEDVQLKDVQLYIDSCRRVD